MKRAYCDITKVEPQDDGTIKVWGYASAETVDADGETITAQAMADALPDYMKFGAVREMHQPKAAGTAIEATVQTDGRTFFGAHVVDAEAVKKVQAKVYKGFSIGGKVLARDPQDEDIITSIKLVEISLVDRPANPDAVFTMFKAEDAAPAATDPQLAAIDELQALVNKGAISPVDLLAFAKARTSGSDTPDEITEDMKDGDKAAKPDPDADDDEDEEDCDKDKAAAETLDATGIAKGLEEVAKAVEAAGLTKGLRGIMSLSAAIYQLVAVQASIAREAEAEGDNSPVPGEVKDGIETLLAALVSMAQEETAELMDDINEAGLQTAVPDWGSFAYASKLVDLAKAAKATPAPAEDLTKADDQLGSILAKFTALEADNADLRKRLATLESQPAPAKAILKAVGKGEDLGASTTPGADEAPPVHLDDIGKAAWAMKRVHAGQPI